MAASAACLKFLQSSMLAATSLHFGAQLASGPIAVHKARPAARYRRATRAFEDAVQKFGFNYILTPDDVIVSRGGVPLVDGGKIVGAIGCSGANGPLDDFSATWLRLRSTNSNGSSIDETMRGRQQCRPFCFRAARHSCERTTA